MSQTIYLVRLFRGDRLVRDFGRIEATIPKGALYRLAGGYTDWSYQDQADGSGRLVNPEHSTEYVSADPVFPDE
jgi:hypothetical protein